MGKKHKPPSRERYEQNNPNWTVRLTLFLFDALQAFLEESDQSRREFIAIALEKQEMDYENAHSEGFIEGFDAGKKNGYETGSSEGFDKSWQQGYHDGQKKGNEEGYTTGYSEGLKRGKKEGYDEGAEYIYEKTKDQSKLWYYCVVCGEIIFIEPNSPEHHLIIDMMRHHGWKHSGCAYRGNPYL